MTSESCFKFPQPLKHNKVHTPVKKKKRQISSWLLSTSKDNQECNQRGLCSPSKPTPDLVAQGSAPAPSHPAQPQCLVVWVRSVHFYFWRSVNLVLINL